jgi:HSP20 family molecular chaperone IbpA
MASDAQRTDLPLWTPSAVMFVNSNYQVIKMELPDVERDGLHIALDGDILHVSAMGRDRRFVWIHPLRYHVGDGHIHTSWHDGALEIDVPRGMASARAWT